jgi:outer membrane protein insertion porin family
VHAADVTDVRVEVTDGFGGDTGSVLTRCQTKVGSVYDPATVTRDVTSLKDSGEFEAISADAKRVAGGVEVVFRVRRKLRYSGSLTVEGNEFFSESRIAKEAELKDGYLYGEADLAAAAAKVRLAYQKKNFADAKVTPVTTVTAANDAEVKFVVDEGKRLKIAGYVFAGADSLDRSVLREAIGDYPWWNPVGWFSDSPVTDDELARCCDKIAEVYRNEGFLDVKVTGPERIARENGKADLRFDISEGRAYRIGKTSITGLTRYSEADVMAKSDLPAAGALAGVKTLDDAAHRVMVAVGSGDYGLADTRVDVKRIPAAEDGVVDVVFKVTEGVPVVINEIKIRGNDYTKDKVIRREIALGPGDRMLEDRAERSRKRLENLDYFSRVRY